MARSKAMRRVRRKGFVQRNEHFWSTVLEDQAAGTIASNVIRFSPVVAPTDWVVRAGFTTANLIRIRGHVSVVALTSTPGGCALSYAVIVADGDDASTFNPMTISSYLDHRVVWTRTRHLFQIGDAVNGPVGLQEDNFVVDIKAKAKLKPDDFVYFVTYNQATAIGADVAIRMHAILRALVVVK